MMEIATIVPTEALHLVEDDPYHLCLVQELRKRGDYFQFYKKMAEEGKFVIVDNGAAEGDTADIRDVFTEAVILDANEVQLPDVFFDSEETVKRSTQAIYFLKDRDWRGKVMAVPQGKGFRDWIQCARRLAMMAKVTTIGVPKNLVHLEGPDGRFKAVEWLIEHLPGMEIHLLGVWQDPREVGKIYKTYGKYVRGVDSGIAAIYAQVGLLLDPALHSKPGKNKAFLNFDDDDVDFEGLKMNIELWRRYCYGHLR